MSTAAIYSRYSSELQSERSIEDQVALCRSYAERESLIVVATYDDRAQSGSSMHGRLGIARLLRDAGDRLFTHVIVESLDRMSRDQADLATLYKRLTFLGVTILEVHGGKATPLQTAVRGLVGAIYLADLADKTRRGMSGRVRAGKSAGGRAYGYRAVPGKPGELEIISHEADAVRRIFELYAAGESPRAIAGRLNTLGIVPPRGLHWNASTINGSRQRNNGILCNTVYRGELVWNRIKMMKDPDTGRRVSRPNPEAEWQRSQVEDLRIVPEALWTAVEARRRETAKEPAAHRFKPKNLLSGLLKCHCCEGSLVIKDRQKGRPRIRCSVHQESGSCSNNRVYSLTRIETAVIERLRAELTDPALITAYVEAYNAERQELAASRTRNRGKIEARLAAVTGEIERTVTMMIKGLVEPERHAPRLKQLEAEEKALKAELAASPTAEIVVLHPAAITRYREQLEALQGELTAPEEPMAALRRLVARIVVGPNYEVRIEGRLAELIGGDVYPQSARGETGGSGGPIQAVPPLFFLEVAA
jgi:site-specific DNA recombinase